MTSIFSCKQREALLAAEARASSAEVERDVAKDEALRAVSELHSACSKAEQRGRERGIAHAEAIRNESTLKIEQAVRAAQQQVQIEAQKKLSMTLKQTKEETARAVAEASDRVRSQVTAELRDREAALVAKATAAADAATAAKRELQRLKRSLQKQQSASNGKFAAQKSLIEQQHSLERGACNTHDGDTDNDSDADTADDTDDDTADDTDDDTDNGTSDDKGSVNNGINLLKQSAGIQREQERTPQVTRGTSEHTDAENVACSTTRVPPPEDNDDMLAAILSSSHVDSAQPVERLLDHHNASSDARSASLQRQLRIQNETLVRSRQAAAAQIAKLEAQLAAVERQYTLKVVDDGFVACADGAADGATSHLVATADSARSHDAENNVEYLKQAVLQFLQTPPEGREHAQPLVQVIGRILRFTPSELERAQQISCGDPRLRRRTSGLLAAVFGTTKADDTTDDGVVPLGY